MFELTKAQERALREVRRADATADVSVFDGGLVLVRYAPVIESARDARPLYRLHDEGHMCGGGFGLCSQCERQGMAARLYPS